MSDEKSPDVKETLKVLLCPTCNQFTIRAQCRQCVSMAAIAHEAPMRPVGESSWDEGSDPDQAPRLKR